MLARASGFGLVGDAGEWAFRVGRREGGGHEFILQPHPDAVVDWKGGKEEGRYEGKRSGLRVIDESCIFVHQVAA